MKLVVNAYMSALIEGVAEALELADRLGVDSGKLAETIEGGPLDSPSPTQSSTKWNEAMLPRSFRSSGRSRMLTWPSRLPAMPGCQCSQHFPSNGALPSTPATVARMSVPRGLR